MIRRLLNTATYLSLLLALAAVVMWVRSRDIAEGWESKPSPSGMIVAGNGYYSMWAVESSKGRLVYASHRILIGPPPHTPPPRRSRYGGYNPPPTPGIALFPGGYYRTYSGNDAITPLRHNRRFPVYTDLHAKHSLYAGGRIPGVVEWCEKSTHTFSPPGRYVAVPWLTIVAAGLIIPTTRAALRRWQVLRRPGFPVDSHLSTPGSTLAS